MTTPIRPTDQPARTTAQTLLAGVRFAALAFGTPAPSVSRIAVLQVPKVGLVSVISELSHHTKALRNAPDCALLIGEAGAKGDPLTHPRLTVHATTRWIDKQDIRTEWLRKLPKSGLYFDFTDFVAVEFVVQDAFLNGGFGKAYALGPEDLSFQAS
jgi:putative heme iron utilization protein